MTLARLISFPLALSLSACVPGSKSLGGDGESDGGSDGDSGTSSAGEAGDVSASGAMTVGMSSAGSGPGDTGGGTDSPPTTGDPTSGGTTDGGCDPIKCEICENGCRPTIECIDGVSSCACDCEDTGAGACDMEEVACALADESKVVPIDCGVATLDDDAATWMAVHDCAMTEASSQNGFKAVFDLMGIDSVPRVAYVGQVGFAYSLSRLVQDGLGAGADAPVERRGCTGLVFTPDCVVDVGFACIDCLSDGGESQLICEPS